MADSDAHAPRSALADAAPALSSNEPLVGMAVPGFLPAVVAVPVGATSRRPVLIAAHGAGGEPEWYCAFWHDVLGARAFVLCPRGRATSKCDPPDQRGYYYPDHHFLIREVAAAMGALGATFPEHVDSGPVVFMGFSQGAIMGALLLRTAPARFSRAVLVEGGFAEWSIPVARAYGERGGQRIVFGCGNVGCAAASKKAARYLDKGGIESQLVFDPKTGHSIGGELARGLVDSFEWLVQGDPRWAR